MKRRMGALAALVAITLASGACGGDDGGSVEAAQPPAPKQADAQLGGVKDSLLEHTEGLNAFTEEFDADAERYYELAKAADFDYARLWRAQGAEVGPLVQRLKTSWIDGNPMYERVEGIVAGTPSLSKYDVILDAGSSAAEDPESAVLFDLTLPSGTVLKQPGNLYNLTEGALWGTLPDGLPASTAADLDRDGKSEFGEALPDANLLAARRHGRDDCAELQVAGWVPVTPIEGLRLPYWAGLWLGIFPTWEGLIAQAGAAAFVLGSYFAAEHVRKRRRRLVLARVTTTA